MRATTIAGPKAHDQLLQRRALPTFHLTDVQNTRGSDDEELKVGTRVIKLLFVHSIHS